jgi:hypothetical protein
MAEARDLRVDLRRPLDTKVEVEAEANNLHVVLRYHQAIKEVAEANDLVATARHPSRTKTISTALMIA